MAAGEPKAVALACEMLGGGSGMERDHRRCVWPIREGERHGGVDNALDQLDAFGKAKLNPLSPGEAEQTYWRENVVEHPLQPSFADGGDSEPLRDGRFGSSLTNRVDREMAQRRKLWPAMPKGVGAAREDGVARPVRQ